MIVKFRDKKGVVRYRTATRSNIRKVAESIQRAHGPAHPLSQCAAVLRDQMAKGRDKVTLTCSCQLSEEESRT